VIDAAIWLIVVIFLIIAVRKTRRTRGRLGVGTAVAGAMYDMLNEDKRRAVEIIVEEKAEARDPEDKDGDLPQLEDPRRRR
jgi:hypothetical protein